MMTATRLRRLLYSLTGLVLLVPCYIMVAGSGNTVETEVIARFTLNGGTAVLETQPQTAPEPHPDYGWAKDMTLRWERVPEPQPSTLHLRQQGAAETADPEAGLLHGGPERLHAHVPVTADAPDAPLVLAIRWWDGRREERMLRTEPVWVSR